MRTHFAMPSLDVPHLQSSVFLQPVGIAPSPVRVTAPQGRIIEDPLAHLPCSTIAAFRKGEPVYGYAIPPVGLHLVIDGKVKVCRVTETGRQIVVDIYQGDDFFGESAFVGSKRQREFAVALEDTKLMSWTIAEIEEISTRKPKLSMALMQLLVQRSMEFAARIESFSVDNIARRLARALLHFSDKLVEPNDEGAVHMIPFTHELLSQYVGTSREIVTQYMNQFRRKGLLKYSRKGIVLDRKATREWLKSDTA